MTKIDIVVPRFEPRAELAAQLLGHVEFGTDAAHDVGHLARVWKNALDIQTVEGGDLTVLCAAVILHDSVSVEKDSPLRSKASRMAAEKATGILTAMGWPADRIAAVAHAVEAHSYSANITPTTLEAKIVQDADRLDAIGAVGVARCFYVSGRLNRPLYDLEDPAGSDRPLDDIRFSLDHFETKLFKLADTLQTAEGRRLAGVRQERMRGFVEGFLSEV